MKHSFLIGVPSRPFPRAAEIRAPGALLVAVAALAIVVAIGFSRSPESEPPKQPALTIPAAAGFLPHPEPRTQPERLSPSEFSRIIRDFSEEGGYFLSDNFASNETAYLHVVSKLRQLEATGGAYVGVGPEQNFTYIAKVRPRIAFIVDIRRQAVIQHMMFKAIFHLAPTRAQYLSLLLSRPLAKSKEPLSADAPIGDIIAAISAASPDNSACEANLATIRRAIRSDFLFQMTDADQASLEFIYKSFRTDGLDIAFKMDGFQGGWFPTLRELIMQPDQFGKLGNFLAARDDYDFVRDLHERNLIIPVVGDFGGKKALASIGDYLRKNGLAVSVFYTSNVEQYLFEGGVFPDFVANVRKMPLSERSLFIRAVLNMRFTHPARLGGHMLTTLLQNMNVFLKDFDSGLYKSYADMVMTHYIAGENSSQ